MPDDLKTQFTTPPAEYGPMPFWFWNGELDEVGVRRQIRELHDLGMGGFCPHARTGLSRDVGYMTDAWFDLIAAAIDEARTLGMKVILYDEAGFPSGSADGMVVAENPDYAARCIIPQYHHVTGPSKGLWLANTGANIDDRLIAVIAIREIAPDVFDPDTLTSLSVNHHGVVHYNLPTGEWRIVAVWDVMSGGHARGLFPGEDDGEANSLAMASLMDPDAVASFIRHSYQPYYDRFGDHFGDTVLAIFTDEPNPLGRGPQRGPDPKAYTPGLLDEVDVLWHESSTRWLPALWLNCGERTEDFRRAYERAVYERIDQVYYRMIGQWCHEHNIAFTGHPMWSDQLAPLRFFQWPGQDIVHRYIEPAKPSALEGLHSVAAKVASSGMLLGGRERCTSEILGAYGWSLTLDELKWLTDWHIVRGVNLIIPHAAYYSLAGRRLHESPPDVCMQNNWSPWVDRIYRYTHRLCWIIGGEQCMRVGVLTDGQHATWLAARDLYRSQIDFIYLDEHALDAAEITGDTLTVGDASLDAIILDGPWPLTDQAHAKLDRFTKSGGTVITEFSPGDLAPQLSGLTRDIIWPGGQDIRMLHSRRDNHDFYLLINEGEAAIEGSLSLAATGSLELWDPMTALTTPWPARIADGRLHTWLRLEPHASTVLAINPGGIPDPQIPLPPLPGDEITRITTPWAATDDAGTPLAIPCPGDWAQVPGFETFSGSITFSTRFTAPASAAPIYLDLGRVGDNAEIFINSQSVGVLLWAPYIIDISSALLPGENTLQVRVTNSRANEYEGAQMPSGLLTPSVLRAARYPFFTG